MYTDLGGGRGMLTLQPTGMRRFVRAAHAQARRSGMQAWVQLDTSMPWGWLWPTDRIAVAGDAGQLRAFVAWADQHFYRGELARFHADAPFIRGAPPAPSPRVGLG